MSPAEPRTEAGRDFLETVSAAVLDPTVAKMLGATGPVLVALVSPDAIRDAILAIEAEEPHGTHTPCCGWPAEHKWADPIRCMKCHEDWPCLAARSAAAPSQQDES